MSRGPELAAIVPSLGASPIQAEMLERLRAELASAGASARLIWVHQGEAPPPEVRDGDRLLLLPRPAGFAAAVNAGFGEAAGAELVAVVNDDVLLERGWLPALARELARRADAAAVQGVNLELERPEAVDGCGLGWNADWQAVQVGHGGAPPDPLAAAFELFGVSATAALYRAAALRQVERPTAPLFEERLGSYYEDVELAVRLQRAGFSSWCVPEARARHLGQATARREPGERWRQIYRNRRWVAAELLGDRFRAEVARIRARDRRDLLRRLLSFDFSAASGILAGTREAERRPAALVPSPAASAAAAEIALSAAIRLRVGSSA
jgi:hypothetical protein